MNADLFRIVVTIFGAHILIKFVLFLIPYRIRRAGLDRQYGARPSATKKSDAILVLASVALALLLYWRGGDGASFLAGLWIGATLIQVFFHRFGHPLSDERAPPPQVSPIKMMSYAIQDAPSRAWREMAIIGVLVAGALWMMWRS